MPWVARSTTPDPGRVSGGVGAPDRIYVMRGQAAGGNDPDIIQTWRILQYVISTNTWTSRAIDAGGASVARPAIAYQAGKVYAFGGKTGGSTASAQTRIWDPTANTWAAGTSFPAAKQNPLATPYSTTKILVYGGQVGAGTTSTTVYEYDTTGNSWVTKTAAASADVDAWSTFSSTAFWFNNRLYVRKSGMSFSVFRTDTNAWVSDQNLTMASGGTLDQFTASSARSAVVTTTSSGGATFIYQMQRMNDDYTYLFGVLDPATWKIYGPHVYSRYQGASVQGPPDWDLVTDGDSNGNGVFYYGAGIGSNSFFSRYRVGTMPTIATPVPSGSTEQTDQPILGLSADPSSTFISNGQAGYVQWQLATDSGFTANVKLVDDLANGVSETDFGNATYDGVPHVTDFGSGQDAGGHNDLWTTVLEAVPTSANLTQTTWYVRARYVVLPDEYGAWSASTSFTISHPPSASGVYPDGGENIPYGAFNFTWNFDDPYPLDTQSAYQIIVERADTGAVQLDTTKTASTTARLYNWTPAVGLKDVLLRWKIRVWDADDVTAGYSAYRTFRVADLPVVTVTGPAEGGTIATAKPTVTWTFSAGGGRTQAKYKVRILDGSTEVHNSGWTAGAGLSYTPSTNILQNGITYTAEVTVEDSYGLQRTDTNAFTTSYSPPAQPSFTVSTSVYDTLGPVRITWTNAAKDASWSGWAVYRRLNNEVNWTLLYFTNIDQANYTFDDYTAGSGIAYRYTVVQSANRFGSDVESNKTVTSLVTPVSGEYWLIVPDNTALNSKLYIVTDDDFSSEVEQEEVSLIDRGRHVDYGTDMGYSGSLSCRLVDQPSGGPTARLQRLNIEAIRIARLKAILRNPFGDVFDVAVGNIAFKRQSGVGLSEMGTITIPYSEVHE